MIKEAVVVAAESTIKLSKSKVYCPNQINTF